MKLTHHARVSQSPQSPVDFQGFLTRFIRQFLEGDPTSKPLRWRPPLVDRMLSTLVEGEINRLILKKSGQYDGVPLGIPLGGDSAG